MAISRIFRYAAMLLPLLCVLSFSAAWARSTDREYRTWRLLPPNTDESVMRPGGSRVDEVHMDASGGFVRMTWFGGDDCRGQIQRFTYSWRIDPAISVISGPRGTHVFAVTLLLEGDENRCTNFNPYFTAATYGDLLARNMGGEARFSFKPQPSEDRSARGFSVNLTNRTEEGIRIQIPFGCPPPGAGGCWLNINYYFEGVSEDAGRTAFCDAYATRAVQQNQESTKRSCGYSGARWQDSHANHNTWCLASTNAMADAETSARETGLFECRRGSDILRVPGGRVLGGIDLMRHCREIYGSSAYTRLAESSVNGWRCVVGPRLESISFEDACRRQYGNPAATARYRNFNSANSWECVTP